MKAVVLSSGSKGNSSYVEASGKRFLLDAGRNYKYIKEALEQINVDILSIDYLIISHNHKDHISALKTLISKVPLTVIISKKMYDSIDELHDYENILLVEDEVWLDESLKVTSFRSSHDAVDSRNYVIEESGKKLAYVTDTGYINTKNFKYLKDLDIYLFESNHDIELLQHGPYPAWLKQRVLSDEGHLSNKAASFYLTKLVGPNTKRIVLIHLSETNNLDTVAMETINNTFMEYGIDFDSISVAYQNKLTDVIEV